VNSSPVRLADRARDIAPDLAAADAEGDQLRRLPDVAWKLLLDGGFLRALQPARWGGGEVGLVEFLDAVVELSRASPSAGWVAGVIGVHPWQLALFADQAQRELWGDDPTTMHSSSYNPTGTAVAVDGGYRVSGRWSFSSGCDHCRGVNLGAVVRGERGAGDIPDFRSFLLLAGEYVIDDTWHVAGLRGSGSKDIVVGDTFVPAHRTQSHTDYAMGNALPGHALNDAALYRLPGSVVFNMAVAASVLGAARGFVDTWIVEARDRVLARHIRLADDALTQRRVAEAEWTLDAGLNLLRDDAAELTRRAELFEVPTMAERGRYRWHLNRSCEQVGAMIAELMRAASGRSVFLDHPLQRRFQDIQAGLGHAFLVPDPLAKAVGGALLGATTPELVL
jgi:3-hydroxy-9,10-secoandrosta-1,3,5(10)-triene-9,17-dione monooxygenase